MDIRELVKIASVAVIAAIAVASPRPGVGWLLAAIALAAAATGLGDRMAAVSGRGGDPGAGVGAAGGGGGGAVAAVSGRGGDPGAGVGVWWVLSVVLVATCVIRAAEWVFALSAGAALLSASAAVMSARTTRDLVLAAPRWLGAGFRGAASIRRGLIPSDRHGAVRLVLACAAGLALVAVFAFLLSAAEPAFERFVGTVLRGLDGWRLLVFGVVALLGLGAAYVRHRNGSGPGAGPRQPARPWGRWEWVIPVSLVDLLFAAFAVVQGTVLFGGHQHVLDRDGPTYAEYAHDGFIELGCVAVLTLAVIAVVLSRVAPGDTLLARVLVGLLCGLTLVIVGSAVWRMQLYAEAFGFTRTRLLATAFVVWVGLIFALVMVLGRREVLPRLVLALGAGVVLALAVANPDRLVAQTVVGRWEKDGHLDAPYLAGLSPDALAALQRLPDRQRTCITSAINRNYAGHDGWFEWNASRAAMRPIVADERDCAYYLRVGYRQEGNWIDPSQLPMTRG